MTNIRNQTVTVAFTSHVYVALIVPCITTLNDLISSSLVLCLAALPSSSITFHCVSQRVLGGIASEGCGSLPQSRGLVANGGQVQVAC